MPADPYAALADLYDLAYGDFDDDIDFYENLARAADGAVLELGVGTGRVAIPLARSGYSVVGLDESPSMLAVARAKLAAAGDVRADRLELVHGDMTRFDLARRFGLVFIAANTFQHLVTTSAQAACLRCVTHHLAPNGIFAMSVRSPTSVSWEDAGAAQPLLLDWTRRDPTSGDVVMKLVAQHPDPARMVREITYIYDRVHEGAVQRNVFVTELRYSTVSEIESLLQHEGLRVTHVYGDYDLSPVGDATEQLIFVARVERSG